MLLSTIKITINDYNNYNVFNILNDYNILNNYNDYNIFNEYNVFNDYKKMIIKSQNKSYTRTSPTPHLQTRNLPRTCKRVTLNDSIFGAIKIVGFNYTIKRGPLMRYQGPLTVSRII